MAEGASGDADALARAVAAAVGAESAERMIAGAATTLVDAQELVEKIDIPKTAGELRQMARETFGKYYGDKVQSEIVHNFAKYDLVLHKGGNNNVQIYGREDMFK